MTAKETIAEYLRREQKYPANAAALPEFGKMARSLQTAIEALESCKKQHCADHCLPNRPCEICETLEKIEEQFK